jgi:hypothetical protein
MQWHNAGTYPKSILPPGILFPFGEEDLKADKYGE